MLSETFDGAIVEVTKRPIPQYYRYMLAFIFAIDEINMNPNILPNVTLRYRLYDSCNDVRKAVESVLQILSGSGDTVPNYSCVDHDKLAGVIGDQNSESSLRVFEILNIYGYIQIPVSVCSEECPSGYIRTMMEGNHKCCFDCLQCSEGEISNETDKGSCIKCPKDQWPNDKNQCVPKPTDFLSYTNDQISIVVLIICMMHFIKTLIILFIFIVNRDTPVIKANNQSLSFLILVSIMLNFLGVLLFIDRPVQVTCLLRQTSYGIISSVTLSCILVKTTMVYLAFKATKPGSLWSKINKTKHSHSIVFICSFTQVLICLIWLSISPPFPEMNTYSYLDKIIIQCNEGSVVAFSILLSYMGLLAAVNFILAFLARNLPDSFNEAKHITFSMLVFCSVWITFIPAYMSVTGKNTVLVEIFAIIFSNVGILVCIFFPKCYIIVIRPDLNTKTFITLTYRQNPSNTPTLGLKKH
ncbi:vomeronasal type-2 receptor 26-like [Pyxicephalus adspersus]|uniref:vomeronasal type-2 receptor 26-like n=1 Tax=Pyxicephalus adspersus TaxID=30357 RepID=UPI003B5A80AB